MPVVPALPDRGVRPPSRADEVVDGIRRLIVSGALRPGDRLPVEKELAAALGVSRGSLREGVRALSVLGVLATRQGAGTYVTSLDPRLLFAPVGFGVGLQGEDADRAVHAVRRLMETEAAGLAARSISADGLAAARTALDAMGRVLVKAPFDHQGLIEADVAFHRAVAEGSGNPVLAALIDALAGGTARARLWRGIVDEGAHDRTHAEHASVLDALVRRDPERARLRMAVHLLGLEDFLRAGREGVGPPT